MIKAGAIEWVSRLWNVVPPMAGENFQALDCQLLNVPTLGREDALGVKSFPRIPVPLILSLYLFCESAVMRWLENGES